MSASYDNMVIGTSVPIGITTEVIDVTVEGSELLSSYAKAFVAEAHRVNPLKAEQVNLTQEELISYVTYLLAKRVECVHNECRDFRKLKVLYMPAYVQYVLSRVGEVTMRDIGLKFIPSFNGEVKLTFEQAVEISEKVGSLDDLQIVRDAMPRTIEGDPDVMSTMLISGFMRSLKPVKHVASTYVSAFLKCQLERDCALSALFRVQYDDYKFILSALTSQKGLFK